MCWMCHVRVVSLIDKTWSHVFCISVDPGLGSQSHVTLSVVVGVVVDELILPHESLVLPRLLSDLYKIYTNHLTAVVLVPFTHQIEGLNTQQHALLPQHSAPITMHTMVHPYLNN